jgi:hypothetical protein
MKFNEWFEAQFGPRSKDLTQDYILKQRACDGDRAQSELNRREKWDRQRNAALKAWYANENEKATSPITAPHKYRENRI